MLAARLHGNQDLRLEEIEEPEPGPGQVKLRVAHNGLCGTDVHEYFTGPLAVSKVPNPLTGAVLPQILGHEFAGVVTEVGSGVQGIAPGERVCVEPIYTGGKCAGGRSGLPNLCKQITSHGIAAPGGGLSQYTVVPRSFVHLLPDTLSLAQGALVEPMSVAFNGVLRSGIQRGGTAVVFGAGPIGVGVFLGLRAIGVTKVIVVEPSPSRRAAIEGLGATDVLDPRSADVAAEVIRRTDGGANAMFDCAGVSETFATALRVAAPRGRLVIIAVFEKDVSFNPTQVLPGEVEIVGSVGYAPGVFERVIDLMAKGHYPTSGWVEHIALQEVISGGFEALRRGERVKVLVDLPH